MNVERPSYKTYKPEEFPLDEYDSCELKLDGWFCCLVLDGNSWELYSRSSRLIDEGELPTSVGRSVMYGEFLYGTEWSKDRPTMYNKIFLFDAEMLDGESLSEVPSEGVRVLIEDFISNCDLSRIRSGVEFVQRYEMAEAPRLWEEKVLKEKYEGLVFKNSWACWGDGFGRMKAAASMDYVCIGFEESDSDSYQGWGVRSIIGGLYKKGELVRVCKVSGLTNDWRKEFYDNPDKYIGRVFEAVGKKISKKGALRHPDFARWRDDKRAEECVWDV
jgi:ATP-dependent DNA ligase